MPSRSPLFRSPSFRGSSRPQPRCQGQCRGPPDAGLVRRRDGRSVLCFRTAEGDGLVRAAG
ncbi:hypothetical protein E5Z02_30820 [Streptomyces rhizosphaericola]|uniref:Uncharacterized protein n=1 Tax=Streptomyces rhizosphaericola TaxID=2564098 RepID=A0ABY2P6A1_9ACTN|nr:hypothetical protein E5Z02_30820 [Streptomyces rhizosphaericola]